MVEEYQNSELDKLDSNGTIKWLAPGELGIIPKKTKIISLTLSFNYKRHKSGDIEERKSRAAIRGDTMLPYTHYDPACTSAPMVERMAVRIVIRYSIEGNWILEHMDVTSEFLHEMYRFHKPVYVREMARADGKYKHGNTIGILVKNLYGNPPGSFYCKEGFFQFMKKMEAKSNDVEECLITVNVPSGSVIAAVAIDDFLVASENIEAMNEFYNKMSTKYNIKRLGRPTRYLGWHFHYAMTVALLSAKDY